MKSLVGSNIRELKTLLANKSVSAKEITKAHYEYIEKHEVNINAFLCLTKELSLNQASAIDELIARKEPLPLLAGIPVAIKDNICLTNYPTTCASQILANYQSPYNASVVEKLTNDGAICVGKTNLDEFAMGSSCENSSFKVTKNPCNTEYVPGGSSGGSAASVAGGFSVIALGSDTGGSIRLPASFCGIVGMKPTYGLVSRYGLVAFASSLDQIGPMGRSVEDVIFALQSIISECAHDSTNIKEPFKANLDDGNFISIPNEVSDNKPLKGMKIGLIKELDNDGINPEVRKALKNVIKVLNDQGAQIDEVSIPQIQQALPVYYIIATAEASSNLARFDGIRYGYRESNVQNLEDLYLKSREQGFGSEVKRRIILGTYCLSSGYFDAYYKKAQAVRRLLQNELLTTLNSYDVLLSPTAPSTAFKINEKMADPLNMYLTDIATIPANLAGIPAISIPCGLDNTHMPIGFQLMGKPFTEKKLLKIAYVFEQATNQQFNRQINNN